MAGKYPGWVPGQDAYADMRPNHDPNHWITRWIRSEMEPPMEREERARKFLLMVSNGATEIKERWALPFKTPGFWQAYVSPPNDVADKKIKNPQVGAIDGVF